MTGSWPSAPSIGRDSLWLKTLRWSFSAEQGALSSTKSQMASVYLHWCVWWRFWMRHHVPHASHPLLAGEGREVAKGATPWVRRQLVSKALYLLPEPFYLSDKKQYTKQWFPTPFLLFFIAEQGKEEVPSQTFPLLGPQIQAMLRACSLLCVVSCMCVCVCVCVYTCL